MAKGGRVTGHVFSLLSAGVGLGMGLEHRKSPLNTAGWGPQSIAFSWFISGEKTMVYGRYNMIYNMI